MKNVAFAVVTSFILGFAVSAFARPPVTTEQDGAANSCKAAGQPCSDPQDCCSRMCRKDKKTCS